MRISFLFSLVLFVLGDTICAQVIADLISANITVPSEKMESFTDYEIVTFDFSKVLASRPVESGASISFRLATPEGVLPFRLAPFDLRADNYRLSEAGLVKNGKLHERGKTDQYRGRLETPEGGTAVFTLDEQFVIGTWKSGEELYYLEPLWQFWKGAPRDAYVLYTNEGVSQTFGVCGNDDLEGAVPANTGTESRVAGQCLQVEIALGADFEIFQGLGSVASVENFMLNTLANVQTNYDDEFEDELSFVVVATVIATSEATDPWTNSTDGSDALLPDFRNWGNAGGFGVAHDVATLWTDRDLDGNAIGWGYVGNGVCNFNGYNICQRFSGNTALLRGLWAHELGHNFNSNHDDGGGFIMSATINPSTSWSNQSLNVINNYYQNQSCFNSCSPPEPASAVISTSFTELCEGSLVTFIDVSTGDYANRSWEFPRGTPSSSTAVAPEVAYPGPGTYRAILTIDGAENSSSDQISVNVGVPELQGATVVFHETFDGDFLQMSVSNPDNQNTWEFVEAGGNAGEVVAVVNNFDNDFPGRSDFLISPDLDLREIVNPTLSIEYAYRRYNNTLRDQLRVTVNGSLGGTQVLFFGDEDGSGNFATGQDLPGRFFPEDATDWCALSPGCLNLDLSAFVNDPAVEVVIENINGYGNYLYVDNIIVFGNCQAAALPVEWLEFTATPRSKTSAQLSWAVNQGEAHAGFTVQRANQSSPGQWTDLDWVTARAGERLSVAYEYVDDQVLPGNTYLYRLRQEDVTGVMDYSPLRSVTFGNTNTALVQPNPTSGWIRVIAPAEVSEYRLLSSSGEEVARGRMVNQRADLDLSTLPRALYFLRLGEKVIRVVRQ